MTDLTKRRDELADKKLALIQGNKGMLLQGFNLGFDAVVSEMQAQVDELKNELICYKNASPEDYLTPYENELMVLNKQLTQERDTLKKCLFSMQNAAIDLTAQVKELQTQAINDGMLKVQLKDQLKAKDAHANKLVYELDKSSDDHMRIIARLKQNLEIAVKAMNEISGQICRPISMSDAEQMLVKIEKSCKQTLAQIAGTKQSEW